MSSFPLVSVIIPTYRRFGPLLDTLADLLAQDYPNFEVIVVDQNTEWPAELLARRAHLQAHAHVRWLTMKPGVVAARNEAVRISRGQILLFIDDDVVIKEPEFIHRHVQNYSDASLAAVAGREWDGTRIESYFESLPSQPRTEISPLPATPKWNSAPPLAQVLTFGRDSENRFEVCTFSTCNGSIRRDAFLAIGGFDENFRGNSYGDDFDLALRLNAKGLRIVYDPEAKLVHLRCSTGGLRLSDDLNPFGETSKALCCWIFFLRYAAFGFVSTLAYHHVLRKTVLLKKNIVRPWRQFAVLTGLGLAFCEAVYRVAFGPRSRLPSANRILP